jgi:DNA-3-methyladenine glycosylase
MPALQDERSALRLILRCMRHPPSAIQLAPIRPLDRAFFARSPRVVARELLGKVLVRQDEGVYLAGRVVEVEAYLGENDPAAHAAAGNTLRNAVLFGPPGFAYVYFIYGNHYCLNVSCEREGKAGCVLFRALEPLLGLEDMARARGVTVHGPRDLLKLTSGPGRLAEAFGITRARDNGCDLSSPRSSLPSGKQCDLAQASLLSSSLPPSSLWIGSDGFRAKGIRATPRIGITKAADRPLRYLLGANAFVSGRKMPI